jgi:hypothetical protein
MVTGDPPDPHKNEETQRDASKEEAWDPPALPDTVTIPYQLIELWQALPPERYLDLRITKQDFDRLYASMNRGFLAQAAFRQSMIEYTSGNIPAANKLIHENTRLLIEAQNDLRLFTSAIMAAAIQGLARGGT